MLSQHSQQARYKFNLGRRHAVQAQGMALRLVRFRSRIFQANGGSGQLDRDGTRR